MDLYVIKLTEVYYLSKEGPQKKTKDIEDARKYLKFSSASSALTHVRRYGAYKNAKIIKGV